MSEGATLGPDPSPKGVNGNTPTAYWFIENIQGDAQRLEQGRSQIVLPVLPMTLLDT